METTNYEKFQTSNPVGGRLIELPHLFQRQIPLGGIDELAGRVRAATRERT